MKKNKIDKQKEKKLKEKDSLLDNITEANGMMKQQMTKQNILIFFVIGAIVFLLFFQYRYERQLQAGITDEVLNGEEDYFQILGLEPNADIKTIRKQYKKLAKVWHPDKHPDCKNCKEKFNKLAEAHDALTKDYDLRKNNRSIFKANPFIITTKNYHRLVEQSNDLWILLAYEQTKNDQYIQSVAGIFDEIIQRYKSTIKFGVIEIIKEEKLISFLPFKLQHFPCIFSYLFGENSEMMDNIDNLTPNSLIDFIEKSYVSKVEVVETAGINQFNSNKAKEKPVPNVIRFKDLQISFFILSPKNFIDLVTKEFAKTYNENSKVYQNDLGFYDDGLKIFSPKNNNRVFVSYYSINKTNGKMVNEIKPIPVSFDRNEEMSLNLEGSFNLGKAINIPKLFRNNYSKHCQRNQYDNSKDTDQLETDIDICVVELNLGLKEINDLNEGLYSSVIENFNSELSSYINEISSSKRQDNYKLHLYFGSAEVKKHENLNKLYNDYFIQNKMALLPRDNSKVFLIINRTHERFVFKVFVDGKGIEEYFRRLRHTESYEDMEFSVYCYFNIFSSCI